MKIDKDTFKGTNFKVNIMKPKVTKKKEILIPKEIKKYLDKVYMVGLKNGGIIMKNKILKSINRDWHLFCTRDELKIMVKLLKKISKIN